MNVPETLESLRKNNRVLQKQLDRSITERQRLEVANRERETLLKNSIRALEASKTQLEQEIHERKLAEAKLEEILKQSEYQSALLRNVIDSSPDWIFVKDCQFRYLLANQSFADSLGKPVSEIIGKTDVDLGFFKAEVFGDSSQEIRGFHTDDQQVLQGQTIQISCESVTPINGSLTWVETQKIPLRDRQGNIFGILGICRNITQRKQAEASLRLSEERYRCLVNATSQIVWISDAHGGNTHLLNTENFVEQAESSMGQGWFESIHPDDRDRIIQTCTQAQIHKQPYDIEFRFQSQSGKYRYFLSRGVPIIGENGEIQEWIGTSTDIHDQKEAESALKQSEGRFQAFMEHCPSAWITDSQGLMLYVNDTYLKSFLLPIQDLIGKSVFEIFPEETAHQFVTNIRQVIESNQVVETIEKAPAADGTLHYFLVYKFALPGNFEHPLVGGVALDITDRKHAEEALRVSVERFQFLANSMPQIIWTARPDGSIDYHNNQMEFYTGLSSEELQDWGWKVIVHPDELQACVDAWIHAVQTGEMFQFECRLKRADGVYRWYLSRGLAMRNEQGEIMQWIGTATDIDDNKKAEAEIRESRAIAQEQATRLEAAMQELTRTQAQIVQSEKMSSLGQLVAGVAHEINNPVNFISGNLVHAHEYTQDLLRLVDLYQNYYPHPVAEIQEIAEEIDLDFLVTDLPKLLNSMKIGAERIQNIVRSLRNFSRMDEAEIKSVDIHEGLDSTLMILQNRLKDKPEHPAIEVVKNYSTLPVVECYAGQLNQVFMNILTNAIDALEEQDQQRSFQEIKAAPSRISITTEALPTQQIRIRIADNGPGISAAVLQRLFDPFFTTKAVGKGTGLGMSISYQIITEKHHGVLYCNSQLGQGAEFVIEIPLGQAQRSTMELETQAKGKI